MVLGPLLGGEGGAALSVAVHPVGVSAMLWGLFAFQTIGMVMSTLHLGKPQYFYRAMNNLRHSWVSREIFAMGTFYHLLGALAVVVTFPGLTAWLPGGLGEHVSTVLGGAGVTAGSLGLYSMIRCYRIKARPFWDHWQSGGAFVSSAVILGSATVGTIFCLAEFMAGRSPAELSHLVAWTLLIGLALQGFSLIGHLRYLNRRGDEAAVSRRLMLTTYGKTYAARWVSWSVLVLFAVALEVLADPGIPIALFPAVWAAIWLAAILHELVGRALFYVVVVPTTHPGAFFWGNKVFETHARKTGLAVMPQVGVVPDAH